MSFRIGQGYDAHQLKIGLPLIIGGIDIPHKKGVLAHSDGDVLIHAIIDAMLGAFNLGDIGKLFPNSSKWENASSLQMLQFAYDFIIHKFPNASILNIDSTIILEKPKLSPYISKMKLNITNILPIGDADMSIKATTTDKLGFIGLEQGIAAQAVCLIKLI